ncbi:MAG: flagellar basal body-associated FliL family protein [Proteobacteria bacterium]|nr:flagellar basal body-associated FliL family protein [Pseudomonadota bacterium]
MAEATAAPAGAEAPAKKGKGKLILFLVLGLVVLGGGGGGAWYFTQAHAKPKPPPVEAALPPVYLALDPPFVVNFESDQQVRFLQVTVQLMSRDPHTIELLKGNDPVVRDQLLMLFANQKYTVLSTREGKEGLRKEALESLRHVLTDAGGHPDKLEAVYFTSFVMQ